MLGALEGGRLAIEVQHDGGKGRAFVLLYEGVPYQRFVSALVTPLEARARVVVLAVAEVTDATWEARVEALRATLLSLNIRQAQFVAFGGCGILVQELAFYDLRLVRTAVFVDATTRPRPTLSQRIVDSIERSLPLGLPLRLRGRGFDGRSFLQRIRCPALVVTTADASPFIRRQAMLLSSEMPTAWLAPPLSREHEVEELARMVADFQEVPARAPQRRRGGAAA